MCIRDSCCAENYLSWGRFLLRRLASDLPGMKNAHAIGPLVARGKTFLLAEIATERRAHPPTIERGNELLRGNSYAKTFLSWVRGVWHQNCVSYFHGVPAARFLLLRRSACAWSLDAPGMKFAHTLVPLFALGKTFLLAEITTERRAHPVSYTHLTLPTILRV